MEIILREDIENLGTRGDVVKVAEGYARNFLLPKKLAVAATDSNRKIVEQERQSHLRKEAKQIGEAQDRIDDVVLGREFQRIHAGGTEGGAQVFLAFGGHRRKALAKSAIVRVDQHLLACFAVLHEHHPQVRHFHFERIVESHGDHFMPLRELAQRCGPPRRADEIGDDEYDGAPAHNL